jgi:phosphoribosylformylglycinamidine synthase
LTEEVGIVLEVSENNLDEVVSYFTIPYKIIGRTTKNKRIVINFNDEICIDDDMTHWRDKWEETSFKLELRQTNPLCVECEKTGLKYREEPTIHISEKLVEFCRDFTLNLKISSPKVAIIRDEGSNGEREMAGAFSIAGFDVFEVTITNYHYLSNRLSLHHTHQNQQY